MALEYFFHYSLQLKSNSISTKYTLHKNKIQDNRHNSNMWIMLYHNFCDLQESLKIDYPLQYQLSITCEYISGFLLYFAQQMIIQYGHQIQNGSHFPNIVIIS